MNEEQLESLLMNDDRLEAIGYASLEAQSTLLGAIQQIQNPMKRNAAISKVLRPKPASGNDLSPRDEAMKRLGGLPKDIRDGLAQFRLQLADASIFAVKAFSSSTGTVRMFTDADSKAVGVTNLNKARLEKDEWFLITHIRVTSGVSADPLTAAYGVVPAVVANGDFELKAGNKYLMPKDTALNVFDTTNMTDIARGVYKLANPKWIEPGTAIEFNIRVASTTAANTNLKVELMGVQVITA